MLSSTRPWKLRDELKIDFGGRYFGGNAKPGPHWCEASLVYLTREHFDSIIPGTIEGGLKCLFYSPPVYGFGVHYYGVCMCIKSNKYKLLGYSTASSGPTGEDWRWSGNEIYRIRSTTTGKSIGPGSADEIDIESRLNKYKTVTYYKELLEKLRTEKKNLEERIS